MIESQLDEDLRAILFGQGGTTEELELPDGKARVLIDRYADETGLLEVAIKCPKLTRIADGFHWVIVWDVVRRPLDARGSVVVPRLEPLRVPSDSDWDLERFIGRQ